MNYEEWLAQLDEGRFHRQQRKAKEAQQRETGSAIVPTGKGGGTSKEAVGANKNNPPKYQGVSPGGERQTRNTARRNALAKLKDRQTKGKGFASGFKSAMGGDHVAGAGKGSKGWNDPNNKAKRAQAQHDTGKKFGNFVKSVPGRMVKAGQAQSGGSSSSSSNLSGPKRGVYNG